MKDYDYTGMMFDSLILIVAATTGNGEAPDSGKLFIEMTNAFIAKREKLVKIHGAGSQHVSYVGMK